MNTLLEHAKQEVLRMPDMPHARSSAVKDGKYVAILRSQTCPGDWYTIITKPAKPLFDFSHAHYFRNYASAHLDYIKRCKEEGVTP